MLKAQLSEGNVVAFQPSQDAGPYQARVVEITNKYKGICLEVNYTHTLYNPRPREVWEQVWTHGKFVVDFWDDFVKKHEAKENREGGRLHKAKVLHVRSGRVAQELDRRGIGYVENLSRFSLTVDDLEKMFGLESCERCGTKLERLNPEDDDDPAASCPSCDEEMFYK